MNISNKPLYRSLSKRMLAGVCGGLGDFFGIDPTIVRLGFVLGFFLGWGFLGIVYLVLWVVVPEEVVTGPGVPPPPPSVQNGPDEPAI